MENSMENETYNLINCKDRFQRAADSGVRFAMWKLANAYFTGRFEEQNFELARKWYQESSNLGLYLGHRSLAYMFENGIGGIFDPSKAFQLYSKAAKSGDPKSLFCLGMAYLHGRSCKKNIQKGKICLKKSADYGSIDAKIQLEFLNATDCLLPDNSYDAHNILETKKYLVDSQVDYSHALLYSYLGSDPQKAEKLMKKAMNANHDPASFEIALKLIDSRERDNIVKANSILNNLVDRNYLNALLLQCRRYRFGQG